MFVLPNLFTISSIFCGFYAIILASGDPGPVQMYQASLAVFFGFFFDTADGRVARLTKTQSAFGVQLDSLADLVTFGVAPAVIIHKWSLAELGFFGSLAAFAYVACGALRLARFNVLAARSPKVSEHFIGLPIPITAGLLVSLVMFHQRTFAAPTTRQAHILTLILVLSYLMISNVRYRSFKKAKASTSTLVILVTLLLVFVTTSLLVRPSFALLTCYSAYVSLGLVEEVVFYRKRRKKASRQPPPESRKAYDGSPSPLGPPTPETTGRSSQQERS